MSGINKSYEAAKIRVFDDMSAAHPSGRRTAGWIMNKTLRAFVSALVTAIAATTAAFAQAPTCNQAPGPGCLYFPAVTYGFTPFERTTFYTDNAGDQREVRFLIRQPLGAPAPMPAIIWSHGGADGKSSPANSMVEWSETSARAGYFTVSIAHAHREPASRRRLCNSIGIADDATCTVFKYLNWDRPHDIRAVLDALTLLSTGEFRGQIDLQRIAVGGHSAGSGGALTVAGARRIFVGAPVEISDPRPIAFLAFSPQQPGSEGFFDTRFQKERHSWTDVHRPVLTATGDGDSTCDPGPEVGSCIGDTPFGRRIGFQRMPGDGNKYHLYLHDANTFHTLFELNAAKCQQLHVDQQHCDEAVRWLSSVGLAFLDAHVRQVPAALQWLQSNRIEVASGGVAEWQRK
jgi:acetyl esterase/lipase